MCKESNEATKKDSDEQKSLETQNSLAIWRQESGIAVVHLTDAMGDPLQHAVPCDVTVSQSRRGSGLYADQWNRSPRQSASKEVVWSFQKTWGV